MKYNDSEVILESTQLVIRVLNEMSTPYKSTLEKKKLGEDVTFEEWIHALKVDNLLGDVKIRLTDELSKLMKEEKI